MTKNTIGAVETIACVGVNLISCSRAVIFLLSIDYTFFPIVKCFIFKDWIGQLNSNKIVGKVLVLPCATAEKNNRTSFYIENF